MSPVKLKAIEGFVFEALESLPKEFSNKLENVAVLIEDWPSQEQLKSIKAHPGILLFGLYSGVPKTKRTSYYSSLPDKITIFAGPLMTISRSWDEIEKNVKDTLLHEIGHHFGLSDEKIYQAMKV